MKRFLNQIKRHILDIKDEYTLASKTNLRPTKKILMYHGVDQNNNLDFNYRHIGAKYFDKHIALVKKHFEVVTLENYFDVSYQPTKPKCVITFDDGYLNNLKYALPILEKHNCHASIFVTSIKKYSVDFLWSDILDIICASLSTPIIWQRATYHKNPTKWYQPYESFDGQNLHHSIKSADFDSKMEFFSQLHDEINRIKENKNLDDYWKLLDDVEIQQLSNHPLITIGSHAVYHNNLGSMNPKKALNELIESKTHLEEITSTQIETLAYPDGSYSRDLITQAYDIGLKYQLAVDYKDTDDLKNPHIEDRLGLYAYESLSQQYEKILA